MNSTPTSRLLVLDGMRGLAAVIVLASHLILGIGNVTKDPIVAVAGSLMSNGWAAVQVFFVLSGFLIAHYYPRVSSVSDFVKKRYSRIFPIYVPVALWGGLVFAQGSDKSVAYLLLSLILILVFTRYLWALVAKNQWSNRILWLYIGLQIVSIGAGVISSYLPDMRENIVLTWLASVTLTQYFYRSESLTYLHAVGTFWSLPVEVVFYLVYPLVGVRLVQWFRGTTALRAVSLYITVCIGFFVAHLALRGYLGLEGFKWYMSVGFVTGIALSVLYERSRKLLSLPTSCINLIGLLCISGALWQYRSISTDVAWLIDALEFFKTWYVGILVAAAIYLSMIPGSVLQRILSSRVLGYIGMISYPLYLTHPVVLSYVEKLIDLRIIYPHTYWIYVCLGIGASLSVAIAIHYVLEQMYFARSKKHTSPIHVYTSANPPTSRLSRIDKGVYIALCLACIVGCVVIYGYDISRYTLTVEEPTQVTCVGSCGEGYVRVGEGMDLTHRLTTGLMTVGAILIDGFYREGTLPVPQNLSNDIYIHILDAKGKELMPPKRVIASQLYASSSLMIPVGVDLRAQDIQLRVTTRAYLDPRPAYISLQPHLKVVYFVTLQQLASDPYLLARYLWTKVTRTYSYPMAGVYMSIALGALLMMIWYSVSKPPESSKEGEVSRQ